jgi:hypothetical protein
MQDTAEKDAKRTPIRRTAGACLLAEATRAHEAIRSKWKLVHAKRSETTWLSKDRRDSGLARLQCPS